MASADSQDTSASGGAGNWALEAERLSLDDPLMECLAIVATGYGRRTTAAALSAGLPVHGRQMAPPSVFIRAAERAGLEARMLGRTLSGICAYGNFPCILVLKDNQACLLKGQSGDLLDIVFPETPGDVVPRRFADIEPLYDGYAFFVRPLARLDERAGDAPVTNADHWFWGAIRAQRRVYYEVMASAVAINLVALASPVFTMNVYDRVVPNNAFSTLWALIIGITVAYLFDFFLKNLRAFFVDAAGKKADTAISARLYEQMLGMRMESRPASVGVYAALLREFETLREFFTSATLITLIDIPFILLFIVMIWVIAGPLAVVPAILLPLVMLAGIFLQRPLDRAVRTALGESAFRGSLVYETFSGLETVKIQAAEGAMQRKWEEVTAKSAETNMKARMISSLGINFAALATNMSSVGIIAYGTYLIADQQMTMGALVASVILAGRAMSPLASVAGLLIRFSQSRKALEQLDEIMQKPVERPAGRSGISMPTLRGQIEFRGVSFSYPHQQALAIRNVSFRIEPGQHVGIIGAVGSGKTTVERLILNLYQPQAGAVLIDGVDVRQIDPADLRRNIGVVQQNPYLFYGSVRENITLGHESVPDSVVLRAAEMAGVMLFLADTPGGLDTQVGERGEYLSGGQRQAISIARALLYDPPVLLMDEPTASIDPSSERRLYNHLAEIIKGKTLLLVTHKSTVLGLAESLILMDHGRMVDMGRRDDILGKLQAGAYARPETAK